MTPENNYGRTLERAGIYLDLRRRGKVPSEPRVDAALRELQEVMVEPEHAEVGKLRLSLFFYVYLAVLLSALVFLVSVLAFRVVGEFARITEGLGRFDGSVLIFAIVGAAFLLFAGVTSMRRM